MSSASRHEFGLCAFYQWMNIQNDCMQRSLISLELAALDWYVTNIYEFAQKTSQYNTMMRQLVEHGDVAIFVKNFLHHKEDTAWIESERQHATIDLTFEKSHDDKVAHDMANRRFKENGGR